MADAVTPGRTLGMGEVVPVEGREAVAGSALVESARAAQLRASLRRSCARPRAARAENLVHQLLAHPVVLEGGARVVLEQGVHNVLVEV